jgi:hypothetical protein
MRNPGERASAICDTDRVPRWLQLALAIVFSAGTEAGYCDMTKPDFTGTWSFSRTKSTLQIPAPDSTLMVIDHREPSFRLSRTHILGDERDTFSLDLTTDGQEVAVSRDEVQLIARAQWDEDTLVFETRLIRAGEEATNAVRYTLSTDRRSFVAEERFRSASLNYDNVWTMERV